jgi:hypothetical protein
MPSGQQHRGGDEPRPADPGATVDDHVLTGRSPRDDAFDESNEGIAIAFMRRMHVWDWEEHRANAIGTCERTKFRNPESSKL